MGNVEFLETVKETAERHKDEMAQGTFVCNDQKSCIVGWLLRDIPDVSITNIRGRSMHINSLARPAERIYPVLTLNGISIDDDTAAMLLEEYYDVYLHHRYQDEDQNSWGQDEFERNPDLIDLDTLYLVNDNASPNNIAGEIIQWSKDVLYGQRCT
jgi:hypothetical protein